MDEERQRFEQWYATHALNHERDPIGSRDCGLQWAAWQAGSESHRAELSDAYAEVHKQVAVSKVIFDRALVNRAKASLATPSEDK